jgi:NAD+ diphosphatase
VQVTDVRYRASQPWPFPANLMLGFQAAWAGGDVAPDEAELEDARWFEREQIDAATRGTPGAGLHLPPPMAIARRLVDLWLYGR